MTLSIAWVRRIGPTPELIFASDSRLTGGGNVDHCQKVFSLPREDCCITFAGSTMIAYPFILQLQNIVLEYKKLLDRALDVHDLRGKVLALLNRFIGAHEEAVQDDFQADLLITSFLFGGWSWKKSRFYIWRLFYDPAAKRYVASGPTVSHQLGLDQSEPVELAHIGDYRPDFMRRLRYLLNDKIEEARNTGATVNLNYEPLAALAEMLADPDYTDRKRELKGLIGGGPQVMKVYPYLRTLTYAVEWDHKGKFVYVLRGRVIADYELFTVPGIDPFTGQTRKPVRGRDSDLPSSMADSTVGRPLTDDE
ncbi:MAG: hypothetical protein QOH67_757 [Hyphomicrobiales bacterium]|nr:hypothetical protein [Hyphomicrobiales bacterium]